MFKRIRGTDYYINKKGVVKRLLSNGKERYLKHGIHSNGYYRVKLYGKCRYIHRLLAETFINNPSDLPLVDHINRNRKDNRLKNLRWVSYKLNCVNRTRRGCIYVKKVDNKKKVYLYWCVVWNLPLEKAKCKTFKTREDAILFLKSLELYKY